MEIYIVTVVLAVLVLYLIMIMPRMFQRPDSKPFDGWLYAHRGLHDNEGMAPENSLQAFQLAVDHGYGIEMDIQLSKDKIPVVFHDYRLKRVCGVDKRVDELTLKELKKLRLYHSKETIPTLEEALTLINGRTPIIVEFKVEHTELSLCPEAAKLLDHYKGVYCMESFNPLAVRWYKKHRNRVMRGQLASNFCKDKEEGNQVFYFLLGNLLFHWLGKPDFVSYNYKYPNQLSLLLCRKLFALPTAAWTVKNQTDFEESKKNFRWIIFDSFLPKE